jgi:hypothetical protein
MTPPDDKGLNLFLESISTQMTEVKTLLHKMDDKMNNFEVRIRDSLAGCQQHSEGLRNGMFDRIVTLEKQAERFVGCSEIRRHYSGITVTIFCCLVGAICIVIGAFVQRL